MAVKKSTKKFQAQKLKGVLEQRKTSKKIKQLTQIREKKKKLKREDFGKGSDNEEEKDEEPEVVDERPDLGEMSVDAFLGGGFKDLVEKKGKRKRSKDVVVQNKDKEEGSGDEDGADDIDAELNELEAHEKELESLKDKDPEFYKFLAENDKELLDFKAAELENLSDIGSSEEEDEPKEKRKKKKGAREEDKPVSEEVTVKQVRAWREQLEKNNSLTTLRKVVLAFRAAAHTGDSEETHYKYAITNPQAYHELLLLALNQVPKVLNHHLPIKENAHGRVRVPTDSKKFANLTPLLKSHGASLLHLLPTLSDSATVKTVVKSATELLPYLISFRKFLKEFTKAVVDIWSSESQTEATRITAFLFVRRAVVIGDEGIKESCIKALYSAFVKGCRNTTQHSLPGINLMKNSAAELIGVDEKIGYTLGFGYIRQLAVHLRGSITDTTKDNYKMVYNWQYVHSLDFWSRALAAHCSPLKAAQTGKDSLLQPLIYPLVQVTLGAIRLIPTQQYFPLHFHLHRALLRLSAQTGVYIPLLPTILTPLSTTLFKSKTKSSSSVPFDFAVNVRAGKQYLGTKQYLQNSADQMIELAAEFFVLYSKHIAFPELAAPCIVQLKRFIKKYNPRGKWVESLKVFLQKLEANSAFVQNKRKDVTYAPNQREEVDAFLKELDWENTPIGAYVEGMRKAKEEREKTVAEGRKADEKRRKELEEEEEDEDANMKDYVDAEDQSEEEDEDEEGDESMDDVEEEDDDEEEEDSDDE